MSESVEAYEALGMVFILLIATIGMGIAAGRSRRRPELAPREPDNCARP